MHPHHHPISLHFTHHLLTASQACPSTLLQTHHAARSRRLLLHRRLTPLQLRLALHQQPPPRHPRRPNRHPRHSPLAARSRPRCRRHHTLLRLHPRPRRAVRPRLHYAQRRRAEHQRQSCRDDRRLPLPAGHHHASGDGRAAFAAISARRRHDAAVQRPRGAAYAVQ